MASELGADRRVFVVLDFNGGPQPRDYADTREWLAEISTWLEAVEPRFHATVYELISDMEADRVEGVGAFSDG